MSQTLYQFVGDIAYFKARNNQHICITCNGRTRSFAGTDFRNQCCVSLQLTVDSNIRSHFFSNLQGFYHFVYHFVFCRTFCRETQQCHFRVNTCDSLSRTCSTNSDLRQLRSIGNGSNGNVTHYQNTILTIFGSMSQQQHCTGNASNARSSLDNLQSRTKHITGSIACTRQLTVGIAVLDNQTAQIKRIGYQLTGFFNSHAFFLTQLEQQLCILFLLGIVFRIDNGCLGNVTKSPLRCTSVDFSRIAQKNQVCNTICQNLIGSFQSAFFRTFRKNNALTIGFRTL